MDDSGGLHFHARKAHRDDSSTVNLRQGNCSIMLPCSQTWANKRADWHGVIRLVESFFQSPILRKKTGQRDFEKLSSVFTHIYSASHKHSHLSLSAQIFVEMKCLEVG